MLGLWVVVGHSFMASSSSLSAAALMDWMTPIRHSLGVWPVPMKQKSWVLARSGSSILPCVFSINTWLSR